MLINICAKIDNCFIITGFIVEFCNFRFFLIHLMMKFFFFLKNLTASFMGFCICNTCNPNQSLNSEVHVMWVNIRLARNAASPMQVEICWLSGPNTMTYPWLYRLALLLVFSRLFIMQQVLTIQVICKKSSNPSFYIKKNVTYKFFSFKLF